MGWLDRLDERNQRRAERDNAGAAMSKQQFLAILAAFAALSLLLGVASGEFGLVVALLLMLAVTYAVAMSLRRAYGIPDSNDSHESDE